MYHYFRFYFFLISKIKILKKIEWNGQISCRQNSDKNLSNIHFDNFSVGFSLYLLLGS